MKPHVEPVAYGPVTVMDARGTVVRVIPVKALQARPEPKATDSWATGRAHRWKRGVLDGLDEPDA